MPVVKRKKARKRRHKKITLKLTMGQYKYLEKYCIVYRTTPNRLIKTLVSNHLNHFPDLKRQPEYHISKNQLKLFDLVNESHAEIVSYKARENVNIK